MVALLIALALAPAQDPVQDAYRQQRDRKLQSPFLKKASWLTDYDKALEESRASGRLIFVFFTMSYGACPPCSELEAGVLSDEAFPKFAKDHVLLCHVTSMVQTDKHQDLLEKKGGDGFPHLVFLDSDGMLLARHGGARTVEGFTRTAELARRHRELRVKAAAGDKPSRAERVCLLLEMGMIGSGEAEAMIREAEPLAAPMRERYSALKVTAEVREIAESIEDDASDAAASRKFYEMRKAGRPEPLGAAEFSFYWRGALDHAEKVKDVAMLEEGLKIVRARMGGEESARDFLKSKEAALRKLKESP